MGATGFDVVGPCERLQVEVAGGLVKPRQNQYVRTMSSPSLPS